MPADGETMGEVMFRGNVVMKVYLKNKARPTPAFADGWFHSGDLGVKHPDGYIQLKDRSKDIIISGGENISSIEVEDALYKHPAVQAAAVVAKPDGNGASALRLRGVEAGGEGNGGGNNRLVPRSARPLQSPPQRCFLRFAEEACDAPSQRARAQGRLAKCVRSERQHQDGQNEPDKSDHRRCVYRKPRPDWCS